MSKKKKMVNGGPHKFSESLTDNDYMAIQDYDYVEDDKDSINWLVKVVKSNRSDAIRPKDNSDSLHDIRYPSFLPSRTHTHTHFYTHFYTLCGKYLMEILTILLPERNVSIGYRRRWCLEKC